MKRELGETHGHYARLTDTIKGGQLMLIIGLVTSSPFPFFKNVYSSSSLRGMLAGLE
jgi:hypothetical protein